VLATTVSGMGGRTDRSSVFDPVTRTDASPADHLETSFQFLNRVATDFWAQVRELVQEWLDRVPDDSAYRDLRGRLRADNAASWSAFLELYLHEMFRRAGYRVSSHPDIPSGSYHPDFLVEGQGESFYVEATMPGPTTNGLGRAQRRAAFLDTIQGCRNRDFFLSLDRLVIGERPARGRHARALIERWLAGLDPDEVSYEHLRREPFRWSEDGWVAEFSAIPISPEHRGRLDHRAIGVYADGDVEFIDDAPAMKAALTTKAKKYAGLDRPLIIALGTYIWDRDHWHSTNALYGHAAVTWWENTDGTTGHAQTRRPDGFFGGPPSWENEQVAAILHVNQLQPQHLHRAEVTLWPHPASPYRWDALSKRIPTATVRPAESALEMSPPVLSASQYFGLPEPWPVGEPFPDE
jgi:hypothetical protein